MLLRSARLVEMVAVGRPALWLLSRRSRRAPRPPRGGGAQRGDRAVLGHDELHDFICVCGGVVRWMRARDVVDGAEQRGDDYDWRAAARALFLVLAAERARDRFSSFMMGAAHFDASLLYEAAYRCPTCARPNAAPTAAPTAANRGLPTDRSYTRSSRSRPRLRAKSTRGTIS